MQYVTPFQGWGTPATINPGLRTKRSALGYYVSAFQAENENWTNFAIGSRMSNVEYRMSEVDLDGSSITTATRKIS